MGNRNQVPDWNDSLGMQMFEQAMHQLDMECEEIEDPEQLMLAIGKVEHCYYVLFMSLRKHLSKPHQRAVRPPNRRFKRVVEDNLR